MMEHKDLLLLIKQMEAVLSITDLQAVMADTGVNYENLSGSELSSKIRSAVLYFNRRNQIDVLVESLSKVVPSIDWTHWGGSLPKEDLRAVLRQLLNTSFSLDELKSLAFDLFYGASEEMSAAQSKTRAVEILIDAAVRKEAVIPLMNWVRQRNPYRYAQYFERVDLALTAHNNKQPEFVPAIQERPQMATQPTADNAAVIVFALRQYANGLNDNGMVAKAALESLGV